MLYITLVFDETHFHVNNISKDFTQNKVVLVFMYLPIKGIAIQKLYRIPGTRKIKFLFFTSLPGTAEITQQAGLRLARHRFYSRQTMIFLREKPLLCAYQTRFDLEQGHFTSSWSQQGNFELIEGYVNVV